LDNSRMKGGWFWIYPDIEFKPAMDWSAYNAISFDLKFSRTEGFRLTGLMLVDGAGSVATVYSTTMSVPGPGEWKNCTIFFKDLTVAQYAVSTNFKKVGAPFDPKQVSLLRIGTQGEYSPTWSKYGNRFDFVVKNIRLLKYGE